MVKKTPSKYQVAGVFFWYLQDESGEKASIMIMIIARKPVNCKAFWATIKTTWSSRKDSYRLSLLMFEKAFFQNTLIRTDHQ